MRLNVSFIRFLVCTAFMLSAAAEHKYKVFRDQYVIETSTAAASLSKDSEQRNFSAQGIKLLKSVGKNKRLVTPNVAAASLEQKDIVDYDPKSDYCYELLKSGLVKTCSPNYELKISATSNDPRNSEVWGISNTGVDAGAAWDINKGSENIVVAVIDTGVDYRHADLAANIWNNPFEIAGNLIDDDGNGYVDDVHGINTLTSSGDPMDDNGHGSHCAGTIGAVGNNGVGIAGINWHVKLMPLKFLASNGSGSLLDAVEAIEYMVSMKNRGVNVKVVNNSWGGGGYSDVLYNAIKSAEEAGIIFVAAAGNAANDNDAEASYPASYELSNVISVAAIDEQQNLADFSNYGAGTVDIAAPGVNILSTTPGNGYSVLSGTSMATPHVSGSLALLFANETSLSTSEAITRLYTSGVDKPSLQGVVATGRAINVARMLKNETSPIPDPNTAEPCTYKVDYLGSAVDRSADTAGIIIESDELDYHKVKLPFAFPFQGELIEQIIISPNGVIYLKSEPEFMDFKNSSYAPKNSIAAFHTDLNPADFGVRVKASADRVTIYWKASHYAYPGSGFVEVRASLFANGQIQTSLNFSSQQLAEMIAPLGTIGVTAKTISKAAKVNGATNNTSYAFTPSCNGESIVSVSSINISRDNISKASRNVNNKLKIQLNGSGNGDTYLQFAFGKNLCQASKVVKVYSGTSVLTSTLNKSASYFRSLSVKAGFASSRIKLNPKASSKLDRRKLKSACDALIRNLKEI